MVELVDTLGSGPSGVYPVGVRISPSALKGSLKRCSQAEVAQSVEQGTENPRVGGSIPPLGINK